MDLNEQNYTIKDITSIYNTSSEILGDVINNYLYILFHVIRNPFGKR